MLRGGFHLCKWKANHPALLEPEDGASQPSVVEDKILKILGILWNPLEDVFRFVMDMKKLRTPCQLVTVQSSLFDPCGFVSPFLIGRQIMQQATHKKRGWDSPLDLHILEEFFLWASSIPLLANYPIPLWWNIDDMIGALDVSVQIFSDASTRGFGAVAYRRVVALSGAIFVAFLLSKLRVIPLNAAKAGHNGSVPKMETSSNVINIGLKTFLKKVLGNVCFVHWTDSECSLEMLQNTGARYPLYYANHLSKIHAASFPDDWRHVDSASNPADFCSRGIWAEEAEKWSTFHRGPAFLWKPESEWPPIKDYLKSHGFSQCEGDGDPDPTSSSSSRRHL